MGIRSQDIVIDNTYFQKASGRKKGCQIDYMIQMRSNTLFVCEVKMHRRELGLELIDAMKVKKHPSPFQKVSGFRLFCFIWDLFRMLY
jgi:uncharacterized protein